MRTSIKSVVFSTIAVFAGGFTDLALAKAEDPHPLSGIPLRNIGPAMISGRISDFAFHPDKKHEFYVATASGNLWKTTNNTITWEPIFDHEGSYSIGVIEIDPNNPQVLWVGSGENNSQRSVAYGDGVYKSTDGGKSWKNVGLKESEHISQIWINPKDSNTVLVAAQGPLWNEGGDRGLYKTTDGGKSWDRILHIDKHTGINEFVIDPDNHENIVASSYQRRRHVWTLINGGPGSGIHKTTDGGKTWTEITSGLPKDHMGRIGLANAPSQPLTIYAIIEANDKEKGTYRSLDFGQTWHKQSSYVAGSPQYYNELVVDPHNPDRVYSLNTFTNVSEDAGKTWTKLSDKFRHVDDHALWIDPDNTQHIFIGGDGGVYESWDRGQTWRHIRNLPLGQFYRVTPDNDEPFYNICGGTQDNNSLCAPSRTNDIHGIDNADWHIILGGDGYEPQFDPNDPNIIYAQYQYGGLARYDRRTEERVYITPHPEAGEPAYKWNWNTPLLVSPHKSTRLYYGSEYLFRSDNRGDSWKKISGDLTRKVDRNQLKVMGRVWGPDSIAKNVSTSQYGSLIGISESPVQPDLLMVGSDDGVISVSKDGGDSWNKISKFSGVPDMSYVSDVLWSQHDADVAYATFDNHKKGDFKPYVLKSTDQGKSWKSISSNLPERGSAHTIVEDHVDPNLMFVGTEFGVFFTQNAGNSWHELTSLPTIAVRDLEIQKRENDLIIGSFGRGVYILDDYTPLRTSNQTLNNNVATLFPVKDTWLYIEGDQFDDREKGSSGSDFFTAPNPPLGVSISYHLKDNFKTLKKLRRETEIEKEKKDEDTPYPSWDKLRAEDNEESPTVFVLIEDDKGNVIRRIPAKNSKGFQQVQWDMRYPAPDPVKLKQPDWIPYWASPPMGPLVIPGKYQATLMKRQNSEVTALSEAKSFSLKSLANSPEISANPAVVLAFKLELAELQRKTTGASAKLDEMENRIKHLFKAVDMSVTPNQKAAQEIRDIAGRVRDLKVKLHGDSTITSRQEAAPWSISMRVGSLYGGLLESQANIPGNYRTSMKIAQSELATTLKTMHMIEADLQAFEEEAEENGLPWTPGRLPTLDTK
ncbi:MAG: hypothetical protein KDI92_08440 [Xanthomonadales bacterium]|nr:hypothetical protein [Xanthomonadales bacterium]